jgi:hypothetical protein
VDFVTVAGRGGRISEVLESAKQVEEARNVGQWLEARMHSMFTSIADEFYGDGRLTREERIALSGGLGDALVAFTATVEATAPQLFERDLWDEPNAQEAVTKESPSAPAGANGKETPVGHIQIEEAEHATLVENASRATALATETATAKAALKEVNDAAAAKLVASAMEAVGVTAPKLAARLAEGYPVKENGALDSEALELAVAESIAELQVAAGAGTVRAVGETTAVETVVPAAAPKHTAADMISALEGGN